VKRFLRFNCNAYYPDGGCLDLVAHFDTLDDAKSYDLRPNDDFAQILDTRDGVYYHKKRNENWMVHGLDHLHTIESKERWPNSSSESATSK
jgi:hypothetical protein